MEDYLKSEHFRRLCEAQDRLHEESRAADEQAIKDAENQVYYVVGNTTHVSRQNIQGMTAEKRLALANKSVPHSRPSETVILTLEERRGLSEADFLALRPELRMEIVEVAVHNRKGTKPS